MQGITQKRDNMQGATWRELYKLKKISIPMKIFEQIKLSATHSLHPNRRLSTLMHRGALGAFCPCMPGVIYGISACTRETFYQSVPGTIHEWEKLKVGGGGFELIEYVLHWSKKGTMESKGSILERTYPCMGGSITWNSFI